jgi:CheY-like chemotaxis protein/transcriptional regulator with XRE-family HTH domain
MTIEEAFGIVLRRLRREFNISQEKLSETSGLDRTFISNMECGKQQPSLVTVFALASALNITPSSIVMESELVLKVYHPNEFNTERDKWEFDWVNSIEHISSSSDSYMGTETILVADDDALVRKMLTSFLTDYGYRVIIAENGQEAINTYHEHRDAIDLVLMDIVMPLKNGIEAHKEILALDKNATLLLTSGYRTDNIKELKGARIIQKPFSPIEIIKIVRNTLAGYNHI